MPTWTYRALALLPGFTTAPALAETLEAAETHTDDALPLPSLFF